jgi:hypothetical protein
MPSRPSLQTWEGGRAVERELRLREREAKNPKTTR